MEEINCIVNLDINENRPILDNEKVSTNDILNVCAEKEHTTVESAALFHSSIEAEKQILPNVNNNFQNDEPNCSLSIGDNSNGVLSTNSAGNITLLSEAEISKAGCAINRNELNIESGDYVPDKMCSGEIPIANVNFLPDALTDEICENLSNSVECDEISLPKMESIISTSKCVEELKSDVNNSLMVAEDLVDFSFREQVNISDDLLGSFTGCVSKSLESSLNKALEKVPNDNSVADMKLISTPADLLDTECGIQMPKNLANDSSDNSLISNTTECVGTIGDISKNVSFENDQSKALSKVEKADDSSLELEKCGKIAGEVSKVKLAQFDISTDNECKVVNSNEAVFQLSANLSKIEQKDFSPLNTGKVSNDLSSEPFFSQSQLSDLDFTNKLSENHSGNKQDEFSPLKVERVSFGMSDKPLGEFTDPAFKLDEICSKNEHDKSDLKIERISFGMSNKSLEQLSDPAIKLCESEHDNFSSFEKDKAQTLSDKPVQQFSDPDFAFKVPEIPSNNPLDQSKSPNFVFKMPEKPLTNETEEQFVDAVQFFRDPNSFQFLESIRTSTVQPASTAPRSSLYVNFDPLHSKFQTNAPRSDNCELISAAVQGKDVSVETSEECSPEVVNKHLADVTARQSLGNILISFDSPKLSAYADSKIPAQAQSPPKVFTEEELQQKLKIHELETQEAYLKKQREMEMQISKRDELLKSQKMVIEEFFGLSFKFSEDAKKNQEKVISLEAENEKLKEDLKTSAEDLQSVENTFTDFYKRYEQCKGMLKTYKDNEEHLKQTILDLQTKAKEQEQMYNMLQERTEEMLEKANVEVDNVKRSGEAQVTVLKAQLKKAEMKISSLESDIKQIKIENSQLGGICDDLMAKVSRS